MAISSADKLVVVKAFAPSNPLPLDAREIYDSLADAQAYATSSAIAYAGQTIKVVEGNNVTVYTLVPSSTEGVNFDLSFVGGGAGSGVQNITTSAVEGNVSVSIANGTEVTNKDVPVVGALVNPVVDEDAHTLTLTKLGATVAQNTNVVIPLGGSQPEDSIISDVTIGDDGLKLSVTKYDVTTETATTSTIQLYGAVTSVNGNTAGMLEVGTLGAAGSETKAKAALVGSVINAAYNSTTKVLTLPVVTGVDDESGEITTNNVSVDMKGVVSGAFVDVTTTADTETETAKHTFTYYDETGAAQTTVVYDSGVRKIEVGATVDRIKVTSANPTTGALTSSEILVGVGNVKNPTYDAEFRKITLPTLQADGTTSDLVINLGKDLVVTSGTYNTTTHDIELTTTDGSVIKIAAGDLIDVYTGGTTSSIVVSVSDSNEITATVRLATVAKNILKVDATNGGLYVLESDFADTNAAIAQTLADAKAYTDQKAASVATTWVDFGE